MATNQTENSLPEKNLEEARILVNYDDPPRLPPPSLSVGPAGWMRKNLFGSAFDTVLTVISAILLISIAIALLGWGITEANWLVINQNFRNFMGGTYPLESTWRLFAVFYIAAFLIGFTVATSSRAGRDTLITIGILLVVLFVVPVISRAALPPPVSYISAGEVAVESGTITESPESQFAFITQGNTQIRVQIPDTITEDEVIRELAGFMDRTTSAFVNEAINKLDMQIRLDEIERTLAANERMNGRILTRSAEVAMLEHQADLLEEDFTPQTERYSLNTSATTVRFLDSDGEMLGEASLTAGAEPFTVDVPSDGWVIMETEVEDADVLTVLETINTYPMLTRSVSENVIGEDGEPVVNEDTGRVETVPVEEYVNVYTRYETDLLRPTLDDEEVTLLRLTDNQYRGERSFVDYMTLAVAPVFDLLDTSMLWFSLLAIAGYGASNGVQRIAPKVPGGSIANVMTMGGWALYVFLLFALSIGFESLSITGLANIVGLLIWVGIMFFIGQNATSLGTSITRPLMGVGFVILLAHLLARRILSGDTIGDFLTAPGFIVELLLWIVVGISALRTGIQNEDKLSASARRRGLIGVFVVWLAFLILIPIIINVMVGAGAITNYRSGDLLPFARFNLWGGFFLTMMLTIVGIVCSFPIGVLLALGRRAHGYPVVKYFCILYIEFVRGVPLVTVLFMASLLVPLLNPQLATVPQVIRAMVGITMFSAAYLAENVRGGLQSLPDGQEEAGKAVGLNGIQITTLILLPQALRAVIPALVGQAIALFKDTSLVIIVGLAELTGVANRVVAQAEFVGLRLETYVFISVVYFIFSYVMSFISRRIEASGSGSARR